MDIRFDDKVVFITGASSGIGLATSRAFAKSGAKLFLTDLTSDGYDLAKSLIKEYGTEITFRKCDVTDPIAIEQAVSAACDRYGAIDIAFNNAGTEGETARTDECSIENWTHVMNTNLRGVWLCMKAELSRMLEQGSGVIVNNSSIAGLVGFPGLPAYVASKHGVVGLTKTAALEFAKSNIRVNAICPGVIETPMIDRFVGVGTEARANLQSHEPMGRMGKAEEIADAVLWLCSSRSSFVTGQALAADGGWVAQ